MNAVCFAIATTTTASMAHILWYWFSSPTGLLGAFYIGTYSASCLFTCLKLILCPTLLDFGYIYTKKPADKMIKFVTQIMLSILWSIYGISLSIRGFSTQANNKNIELPLLDQFVYLNLCLQIYRILVHSPLWLPNAT